MMLPASGAFSVMRSTSLVWNGVGRHSTNARATASYGMEDITNCASDGLCSIDEMEGMIRELDEINSVCSVDEDALDDCNDASEKVREMLKEALSMRVQLDGLKSKIRNSQEFIKKEAAYASQSGEDHTFDHYVDYKIMAQYESH
eukprot:CAMPEP_0198148168 /NCGR_PEP_ID=MMETSP1443-20131203/40232_1 /TAXON_ID=186043 /ORGANISM="Entomoneis sp., Strain CCMP2396" /LENGTH=144 /DNA_ID=CAMNT_0043812789 /DNA_START=70 /DNA_END=504 /DNA_ORIENTATION=+